ncbi:peroxisomal targeting signal 2 receptor-like [Lineus longissimus]|uniref:peroxisomal targeting signal 2 receptor-like n=1 Tax=Lineus longissimus TaxID=88925 RepID=UPI002B4CBB43
MSMTFTAPGFHGYAVEFSPYSGQLLAAATCENFGVAGTGRLIILQVAPQGIAPVETFNWPDALFDVGWCEKDENVLLTCAGDGSIQVWTRGQSQKPVKLFKEHTKEVYSLEWSQTRGLDAFVSGSWDHTLKLWDLNNQSSLATFHGHDGIVYSTKWSPLIPGCIASASGDHTVRLWDIRGPQSPKLVITAHDAEVLTCDWSKYNQNMLVSGGVDGELHVWDIRQPRKPMMVMAGHKYAVRRLKCSPFSENIVASCSYDMTMRFWDLNTCSECEMIEHHTEFIYGLDFNLHIPGQMADCGFDSLIHVYTPNCLKTAPEGPG